MPTQDDPEVTPPEEPRTHSKAMLQASHRELANVDGLRPDQPSMTGSQRRTANSLLGIDETQVRPSTMLKTRSKDRHGNCTTSEPWTQVDDSCRKRTERCRDYEWKASTHPQLGKLPQSEIQGNKFKMVPSPPTTKLKAEK